MNKTRHFIIASGLICGALTAGPARPVSAARHAETPPPPLIQPEEEPARVLTYSQKDLVPIKTKLRYTTLIVLPKTENILDFACGDKDYWVVNGSQNFAYIKPAKSGAQTNLNLITASGNIYSFLLSEVGDTRTAPDLKVFIELHDEAMAAASRGTPRFVAAEELETIKKELDKAQDEARQNKQGQAVAIQQGINRFVSNVRFSYRFEAGRKPFFVRAMYHDEHFTYIQARPEEAPTLYEIKDGQPNLVNFAYKDGVYVVEKILSRGYLVIGKQKLVFTREE